MPRSVDPTPDAADARGDAARLDPAALAGLLAEAPRRRAFAAVALGATTAAAVADAAGLSQREATAALERLAAGGLVRQAGAGGLEVDEAALRSAARAVAASRPEPGVPGAPPGAAEVLRAFVVDGRLTSIPAQRSKRLVVLDWLAQRFEPGETYSEAQVGLLLGQAHADVAALRRYLVDEGILDRSEGRYWRAGGTVDVVADGE